MLSVRTYIESVTNLSSLLICDLVCVGTKAGKLGLRTIFAEHWLESREVLQPAPVAVHGVQRRPIVLHDANYFAQTFI